MAKVRDDIDFACPSLKHILEACPKLQWRQCHDCGETMLYPDNVLPAVTCRNCNSKDTRLLIAATQLLNMEGGKR